MSHIRDKLPDMKARLNTLMGQAQQELDTFGDEAIYGDTTRFFLPPLVFLPL
jgi:dynamin 1-like protein